MLSMEPRGIRSPKRWHTRQARPNVSVRDAVGAIRMLRTVSYADASRVAIMGWSWGAAAALKSVEREGWMKRFGERPRAAVAFYPRCDGAADYVSPSMILKGAKDEEASPALCVGLIEGAPVGSELPELILYRGAHHRFDDPNAPDAVVGGIYRAFNPKAAANAMTRIRAFFMKNL